MSLPASTARSNLQSYLSENTYYTGASHASSLPSSGNLTYYSLALSGYNNLRTVPVLHSDTAFRLFFINSTNQPQLSTFLNATANSILRPFPAGLLTPVGMVVANPALSGSSVLVANFTNSAYHGTVVWSWQLAMMAEGLRRQLHRCNSPSVPDFCGESSVYGTVKRAYNTLWTNIESNRRLLQGEVWSWTYSNSSGYKDVQLGSLPPPPGVSSGTESNVRQLWSLTFLAVRRDEGLRE